MPRRLLPLLGSAAVVGGLCLGDCLAADDKPAPTQLEFFEKRIRPLLADNCYQCHGPDKQKSSLRLDSREGLLRGGASGMPLVVAGQPDKSLLIRAVRHQDDMLKMPPKRRLNSVPHCWASCWSELTDSASAVPWPGWLGS